MRLLLGDRRELLARARASDIDIVVYLLRRLAYRPAYMHEDLIALNDIGTQNMDLVVALGEYADARAIFPPGARWDLGDVR